MQYKEILGDLGMEGAIWEDELENLVLLEIKPSKK
jgi:hypothetical protein